MDVGLDYLNFQEVQELFRRRSSKNKTCYSNWFCIMGVLYILDEPSIGLHQRDNDKLIQTLKNLRDVGNTVIVVEHDEDTMREADYIVDIGPRSRRTWRTNYCSRNCR